ncbi:hypothetical protein PIB30_077890 [Stylosanthes scabra]|uniref:Uncharacterized protein n=1 Tax=Stylosanthes scabra TaxID=79078 RepID=A0ABU6SSK3_9FABA|nr:hypothetical protein [Stylosanthes scabra]
MGTSGERRQPAGADRSKAVLCRGGSELGVLVVAQLPRSGCGSHQRTKRRVGTNGGAKLDGVAVESKEKTCNGEMDAWGEEQFRRREHYDGEAHSVSGANGGSGDAEARRLKSR